MKSQRPIHLIIITGMSGAGKTVAIQSLEDLGYFCVDNMPSSLIPKFVELIIHSGGKINKIALVIDLRGREFFETLFESLASLEKSEMIKYEIIFLEADDNILVRRYKETRRRHPLSSEGSPIEGIATERKLLEDLKGKADQIINTGILKPNELKERMISKYSGERKNSLSINIMSFGFKYGVPIDADLVFDVRFLPNPHYVESLRPKTGLDISVKDYVMGWEETNEFLLKLTDLLKFLIPNYQKEGKSNLVIGIGCTGGKHRSVAISEYIVNNLQVEWDVSIKHRDISKDHWQVQNG